MVTKKEKSWIWGVFIVLGILALAHYNGLFSISGSAGEAWTARFASARCDQTGYGEADSFSINSIDDNQLKTLKSSSVFGFDKWYGYRCGVGTLNYEKPTTNAYTNICTINAQVTKTKGLGGNYVVYKCRNEYNFDVNPDSSQYCTKMSGDSISGQTPLTLTTEDIASNNGVIEPQGKYTIYAIGLKAGFLSDISLNGKVNSPKYHIVITEGSGYTSIDESGCSLNKIANLNLVFPSSVKANYKNTVSGNNFLAFGSVVNWVEGYSPILSANIINHATLGKIYVTGVNKYIPITQNYDGHDIAFIKDEKTSTLIECIPNTPDGTCDNQAKKIKDLSQATCSSFVGFKNGDGILLADGRTCTYNCINGKPDYSNCKTITSSTCPQNQQYSISEKRCVTIATTTSIEPIITEDFDFRPLFVIGIIFIIAVILILIAKKKRR